MTTLAICTTHNKRGRHDGDEFRRECARFVQLHGAHPLYYGNEWKGKRRRLAETFVRSAPGPIDTLAIFGHGGKNALYCTGHARRHLGGLVDALQASLNPQGSTIVLYACLAGKGWGWADQLDVALEARGLDVKTYSHTTAGHLSRNPNTEDSGEGPRSRGVDLIPRGHPLRREWIRRLNDDQDFRLSFWQLSPDELLRELAGRPRRRLLPPLPERVKNQH